MSDETEKSKALAPKDANAWVDNNPRGLAGPALSKRERKAKDAEALKANAKGGKT